jgi:hypothetical protein
VSGLNGARNQFERGLSPAYQELLADRAAEAAELKRQQEAEEAARIAADPVLSFQKSTSELYASEQQAVLHGVVNEIYLASFGHCRKGTCSEEQKVAARTKFRETATDYIRNATNGATLCAMVDRNGLHPGDVESYLICHEILKIWGGYVDDDPVEEAPVPAVEPEVVLTPSQKAEKDYEYRHTVIVVYDPVDGKGYTEYDLDTKVDSQTELRLRRLMEGRIGNNRYEEYMRRKDIRAAQQDETNQIATQDDRDERL